MDTGYTKCLLQTLCKFNLQLHPRLRNDLYCVEWDVRYSNYYLIHIYITVSSTEVHEWHQWMWTTLSAKSTCSYWREKLQVVASKWSRGTSSKTTSLYVWSAHPATRASTLRAPIVLLVDERGVVAALFCFTRKASPPSDFRSVLRRRPLSYWVLCCRRRLRLPPRRWVYWRRVLRRVVCHSGTACNLQLPSHCNRRPQSTPRRH